MDKFRIADLGAGNDISMVEVVASDKNASIAAYQEDMEKLTYANDSFDVVHCRNAVDHTKNALAAVKEMIRVCKPGGWVYIKCWLDQKSTKGHHYWSAKEDGVFTDGDESFDLKDLGFRIRYTDLGGERRYNYIEATFEKPHA
jgi:SAM-dependent methyltransferase